MPLVSPLSKELELLGNPTVYKIIRHKHCNHLAIGVSMDDKDYFFKLPIDISDEPNNILDDGRPVFRIAFLSEEMRVLLKSVIKTNISVKTNNTRDRLYLSNKLICIELFFSLDYMEDYMILCAQEIDQTLEELTEIYKGNLTKISMLCKKYEQTVPMLEENNTINRITSRVTAEIGLQLAIDDSQIVIAMPTQKLYEFEPIEIYDDVDAILEFVENHQLRKTREI